LPVLIQFLTLKNFSSIPSSVLTTHGISQLLTFIRTPQVSSFFSNIKMACEFLSGIVFGAVGGAACAYSYFSNIYEERLLAYSTRPTSVMFEPTPTSLPVELGPARGEFFVLYIIAFICMALLLSWLVQAREHFTVMQRQQVDRLKLVHQSLGRTLGHVQASNSSLLEVTEMLDKPKPRRNVATYPIYTNRKRLDEQNRRLRRGL